MSLPNPVEQKSHDVINNKLSRVMKEVAEESMEMAAVEENSSSPDNLLTVSGDGTWKTRGHSSLIGVCTVIGAETGKVLDREVLSSFCKECDSYKGVKFGIKYNKWQRAHKISCRKNYSCSAGKMEVDGMLKIFNRSEKLHNLKYSNYIGDGDTKTFNALSENKPYGDDYLIQKIECVGHVQKRMGTRLRKLILVYSKKKLSDGKTIGGKERLTDSLTDKLAHYYGNAIRCNSTSVKEMRKAIWAVWGHSCSTDDEPMHWFCPTNPNTWYLSHPALLKKCLGEKFGLKINRNVCVPLAERDNRRIFTSRQRLLESSFEARRAKKIKKSKEIELFKEQEGEVRELCQKLIYDECKLFFSPVLYGSGFGHPFLISQAATTFVRLVGREERLKAPDHLQGNFSESNDRIDITNQIVTSPVWCSKATAYDRQCNSSFKQLKNTKPVLVHPLLTYDPNLKTVSLDRFDVHQPHFSVYLQWY
ncbi:uncharacterized protein TNCV_3877951 [Trichonephila clavipes]|uniref:Mutator-like transposase domain-containing protein n=1 Tax=Trichonephila clavipes TaxID=2585209 RepID=A0A8X6T0X4_TRICX|nr:uncharacterized protein TNCV_3877951 [Trichonephila clavipes]